VGETYWPVYFETLRRRLAPGGAAVIQAITIGDEWMAEYRRGADFIQHYIFPGGMLPSPGELARLAAAHGFIIARRESFGLSYARTLVEWRARFHAAWPAIAAQGFAPHFRRLWDYYLIYCEAGFRTGRLDVGLWRLELSAC
jgi:cyclopropane-fatty-acyl-phospholipid synthase